MSREIFLWMLLAFTILVICIIAPYCQEVEAQEKKFDCSNRDREPSGVNAFGDFVYITPVFIPNYQLLDCEGVEIAKKTVKSLGWCGSNFDLEGIVAGARCADITKKEEYCSMVQPKITFRGFNEKCKK